MHLAVTDYLKVFQAEVLTEEDVDLADLESDDVPAVAYGADQDRPDREFSVPLVRKVSACTQDFVLLNFLLLCVCHRPRFTSSPRRSALHPSVCRRSSLLASSTISTPSSPLWRSLFIGRRHTAC